MNQNLTKGVLNVDNSVDLFPMIAMALFEATSLEWMAEVEDRDYARSIRRWVEA